MKRLIVLLLGALALCLPAAPVMAQNGVQYLVVSACGTITATPPVGTFYWGTMLGNGEVCTSGGGGGGGGAVTIADGADITQGAKADAAATDATSAWSLDALLKGILGQALSTASSPVSIDQTTQGTTNGVQLRAGSAVAGKFGIDQTTPGTTNAVQPIAGSTGGTTPYGLQSAASTNSTSVKASAGVLYGMNLLNTTATIYYLRMYDLAAGPTCSSATGFIRTWPVPPYSAAGGAGGIAVALPSTGTQFSTGIAFCLTGGPSSTDNTNAATGVFINLDYK